MTLQDHATELTQRLQQAIAQLQEHTRAVEQLRGALAFCQHLLAQESPVTPEPAPEPAPEPEKAADDA